MKLSEFTSEALKVSGVLALLGVASVAGVTTYQAITLPKLVGAHLDSYVTVVGQRLDVRDRQIGDVLSNVKQFVNDTYYDNYANVESTTEILHSIAETLRTVNTKILPQVSDTLAEVHAALGIVQSMRTDLDTLTGAANSNLEAMHTTLDNAATLMASLDQAVKTGSPKVTEVADQAQKAIADFDKLLADPHTAELLAHVEGTSGSVDKIMKKLSTKVGILKTILNAAINMVRVQLTAPQF